MKTLLLGKTMRAILAIATALCFIYVVMLIQDYFVKRKRDDAKMKVVELLLDGNTINWYVVDENEFERDAAGNLAGSVRVIEYIERKTPATPEEDNAVMKYLEKKYFKKSWMEQFIEWINK